jgi:hypothetical protein
MDAINPHRILSQNAMEERGEMARMVRTWWFVAAVRERQKKRRKKGLFPHKKTPNTKTKPPSFSAIFWTAPITYPDPSSII